MKHFAILLGLLLAQTGVLSAQERQNIQADANLFARNNRGQGVALLRYDHGRIILTRATDTNDRMDRTRSRFVLRTSTWRVTDTLLSPFSKIYSRCSGNSATWGPFRTYLPLQVEGTLRHVNTKDLNRFLVAHGQRDLSPIELASYSCSRRALRQVEDRFQFAINSFERDHKRILKDRINAAIGRSRIEGAVRALETLQTKIQRLRDHDLPSRRELYTDDADYLAHAERFNTMDHTLTHALAQARPYINQHRAHVNQVARIVAWQAVNLDDLRESLDADGHPLCFSCPIGLTQIVDPVVVLEGGRSYVYDRANLQDHWNTGNRRNPSTNTADSLTTNPRDLPTDTLLRLQIEFYFAERVAGRNPLAPGQVVDNTIFLNEQANHDRCETLRTQMDQGQAHVAQAVTQAERFLATQQARLQILVAELPKTTWERFRGLAGSALRCVGSIIATVVVSQIATHAAGEQQFIPVHLL